MALGYMSPYRPGTAQPRIPATNGATVFDINRMIDALFEQHNDSGVLTPGILAPALDVHQDDDKIEITAELPGVKEEDIEVTVEDRVLTFRGEKRTERSDKERGYTERSYGTFMRRISLPPTIDEATCSANFVDGVLRITMPTSEQKSRGRRIELQSGKSAITEAASKPNIQQNDIATSESPSEKPTGTAS